MEEESQPASISPTPPPSEKSEIISCPQPQLDFLRAQLGGGAASSASSSVAVRVVEEIQSAQQRVLVLRCCCCCRGGVCCCAANQTNAVDLLNDQKWSEALRSGRNHVVLRIWKGANRWWNLNHTATKMLRMDSSNTAIGTDDDDDDQDPASYRQELLRTIAEHEVWGYRTARETFQHNANGSSFSSSSSALVNGASSSPLQQNDNRIFSNIRVPAVLNFSNDDTNDCNENNDQDNQPEDPQPPWAIFEYVGPHSALFQHEEEKKNSSTSLSRKWPPLQWDDSWMTSMIRTRDEFGFAEPHPRWGRVPVPEALEYALTVLHSVVLPLHNSSRNRHQHHSSSLQNTNNSHPSESIRRKIPTHSYKDVAALCRQKYEKFLKGSPGKTRDNSLQEAILQLGVAIGRLEEESSAVKNLPPVLCHMDLQPQNILFARHKKNGIGGTDDRSSTSTTSNKPFIVSVLDWEEAAYADPRFELLMLCRRVCANRAQADRLWQTYQEQSQLSLGLLDPWLWLETVHSLTTLLLQATAGGGRSPWETKQDLRDKIAREFERLRLAGWDLGAAPPIG